MGELILCALLGTVCFCIGFLTCGILAEARRAEWPESEENKK
jgi:hypothetical protein